MARSLKERYENKRILILKEKAKDVDRQLMVEERAARLIIEAMDTADLDKVTQIVQKLGTLKRPELPNLTKAIEQAETEINKYTAGGPIAKGWAKMKNLVGIDNPIVKVTTFADALEKGFSQIPQILKNNGVDLAKADLNKSLASMLVKTPTGQKSDKELAKSPVTGKEVPDAGKDKINVPKPKTGEKSDADLGKSPFTGKSVPDKEDIKVPEGVQNEAENATPIEGKLKNIVSQLQKALSPGGIFGAFKKVPYIDSASLAQELVKAPLNVFSQVAKAVQQGAKAAEIAPDLKSQITGQGGAETKGTGQGDPAQQTSQTQPSTPAKDAVGAANSSPTGEAPPQPRGGGASQKPGGLGHVFDQISAKTNVDRESVAKVIKHLADAGLVDVNKLQGSAAKVAA